MGTITVNGPKTPVTEGSGGIAMATLPNICKMPGPPAPFVPTPLPNIGKSDDSPKDYSKNVKFDGKAVAIRGATFKSKGDVASQGTGGGLISSNVQGPTSFIGPGSLDVKVEGKNVQLLGDPMLNNCGPGGSPPNAATMTGVIQGPGGLLVVQYGDDTECPLADCDAKDKKHPIPQGEETITTISKVFANLSAALRSQRKLMKERSRVLKELERLDLSGEGDGPRAAVLETKADALEAQIASEAVLKRNRLTGDFDRPYMIGALICGCRKDKKYLVTASGEPPPGFLRAATTGTGFSFVPNTFSPSPQQVAKLASLKTESAKAPGWSCAAPKLIDAAKGHQPGQLSERWYAPLGGGVTITFSQTTVMKSGKRVTTPATRRFESGETCPSCNKCQNMLPAMVCKAKCN